MQDFVVFDHVCKTYQMGDVRIEALKDASFTIDEGEICVIVGQSGAGKTTLLNILGGMDRLTSGHVLLAGEDVADYSRKRLTTYRRHEVGFVFQFYNLLPNMTALENVQIASQLCKDPLPADEVLRQVGLARWQSGRSCCCATSRPARSTTRPASRSCPCCRRRVARAA